jgi:hypothetical protein
VSAKSKTDKPFSHAQFVAIIAALAIAGVLALFSLARVAGPHGTCPTDTQVSRPGASICWAAYRNTVDPGVVGHAAATN